MPLICRVLWLLGIAAYPSETSILKVANSAINVVVSRCVVDSKLCGLPSAEPLDSLMG